MRPRRAETRAAASRFVPAAIFLVCLVVGVPAASAGGRRDGHLGSLMGKPYSEDKARAASNVSLIRVLPEGETVAAVTMSNRLDLVINPKGTVIRARCG